MLNSPITQYHTYWIYPEAPELGTPHNKGQNVGSQWCLQLRGSIVKIQTHATISTCHLAKASYSTALCPRDSNLWPLNCKWLWLAPCVIPWFAQRNHLTTNNTRYNVPGELSFDPLHVVLPWSCIPPWLEQETQYQDPAPGATPPGLAFWLHHPASRVSPHPALPSPWPHLGIHTAVRWSALNGVMKDVK